MSDVIEYKVGDIDRIGAILKQNDVPINLTGGTVKFILRSPTNMKFIINCTLGGVVDGNVVTAVEGGVTIPFTSSETATVGQYRGEFLVYLNGTVAHIPSGNTYYTISVYEAL